MPSPTTSEPTGPTEPAQPAQPTEWVLTLSCPDRPGIVHAVSGVLAGHDGDIVESHQFGDRDSGRFFMRIRFTLPPAAATPATTPASSGLHDALAEVAARLDMTHDLRDATAPTRTLVLVSTHLHCLNDLLFRTSTGSLPVEVPLVVSNHPGAAGLAASYGVGFEHLPVTRDTKAAAEARILELVEEHDVDLVVLARYMQILSDDLCSRLAGRAINIHHSFLPSFKGAKPYHQAFDRGVKIVGATAHYVTADLDEGPIIEQDVMRVDHAMTQAQLVAAGRDVEAQVLSRAVRWHAEQRVLLNGHRTIVFR